MNLQKAKDTLIQQAAAGDASAFEALMAPYEQQFYSLCLRIAGNREDALDCAQEAMLRIWRSLPKYRYQSALTTWCYRIATNTCLDLLRRQKYRPSVSLDQMTDEGFSPAEDEEHESNPEANFELSARKRALTEAIAALPPNLRAALVLRDVEGLPYDEISEILALPGGTVRSRISRAREKLKELLTKDCQNVELFPSVNVKADEGRRQA